MLSSVQAIAGFFEDRHAIYVSSFRVDESSKTVVLEVPVNLLRERAGKGFTSRRQLAYLKRDLAAQFGLRVIIALRESQQLTDLELGLRAMLLRKFPEYVADLYMSFPTGDVTQVWVTIKQELDEAIGKRIQGQITEFLADAALRPEGIEFVPPSLPEPSIAIILRSVKAMSPAGVGRILNHLQTRGYPCPSERWLSGKLDSRASNAAIVDK